MKELVLPGWTAKLLLLIALVSLSACSSPESNRTTSATPEDSVEQWELEAIPSPSAGSSTTPRLISGESGLVLSWLSLEGDAATLKSSVHDGERWSDAKVWSQGSELLVNWADFPSVVPLPGGAHAAHWLQRDPRKSFAYGTQVLTPDGERHALHDDDTSTEHGFVSLLPDGPERIGAVWLDGRQFATDAPRMELRFRSWSESAKGWSEEVVLDDDVCTCCDTDAVALPANGATEPDWVVAYRDHTGDEIRDIAIVRRVAGNWTQPQIAHPDGWRIAACPVNGPALAAREERVALAWYSGAAESSGVKVAVSENRGERFGTPVRLDNEGLVVGRADVEWVGPDRLAVIWLERSEDPQAPNQLWLAYLNGSGQLLRKALVTETAFGREAGFPQLAIFGDALWFAWKHHESESQITLGRLPLSALSADRKDSAAFTGSSSPRTARLTATP